MNNELSSAVGTVFLVTVWTVVRAAMGRAEFRTISHERAFLGMSETMSYIGGLDEKCSAEVRTLTPAEVFGEYAELVRNARTAGLVRGGVVTDHTASYTIPEGAAAAASTYRRLAVACEALMSGVKARGRRAELESVHDRAKRMAGLMSDLADAN